MQNWRYIWLHGTAASCHTASQQHSSRTRTTVTHRLSTGIRRALRRALPLQPRHRHRPPHTLPHRKQICTTSGSYICYRSVIHGHRNTRNMRVAGCPAHPHHPGQFMNTCQQPRTQQHSAARCISARPGASVAMAALPSATVPPRTAPASAA